MSPNYILFDVSHTGKYWNCNTAETFIFMAPTAYTKHIAHKHCHNTHTIATSYTRNYKANIDILISNLKYEYCTYARNYMHNPLRQNGYKWHCLSPVAYGWISHKWEQFGYRHCQLSSLCASRWFMGPSSVWCWVKHFRDCNMDIIDLPCNHWQSTIISEGNKQKVHVLMKHDQSVIGTEVTAHLAIAHSPTQEMTLTLSVATCHMLQKATVTLYLTAYFSLYNTGRNVWHIMGILWKSDIISCFWEK